ncbi:hypothetical protein H0H93_008049 [Arthromyces matolae]|nr:hypothetical protein H0H93_008049 [Arthromyces matolae]
MLGAIDIPYPHAYSSKSPDHNATEIIKIHAGKFGLGAHAFRPLPEGAIIGGKCQIRASRTNIIIDISLPRSEYIGEILDDNIVEHAAYKKIHDHTGFNYMYDLQHGITVDAAKLGNETRFLNDFKDIKGGNNCEPHGAP